MTAGTRLAMSLIAVSLLAGCATHRGTPSPGASSSAAAMSPGPTTGASHGTTSGVDSGVSGQTMVDGGCPVLRPESPCPDRPLPARIVVVAADSAAIVTSIDTDSDGRFRIPLAPGRYVLQPSNRTGVCCLTPAR